MSPDRISQITSAMAAALVLNAPNEGYDEPPLAMLDKTLAAVRASVLPHLPVLH
jgi:hypothetical protein